MIRDNYRDNFKNLNKYVIKKSGNSRIVKCRFFSRYFIIHRVKIKRKIILVE